MRSKAVFVPLLAAVLLANPPTEGAPGAAGASPAAGVKSGALPPSAPGGELWWSHVEYLASDRLKGRATGSEEHRLACNYVATQLELCGVKPGGVGGYMQPVPLIARRIREGGSSLELVRDGKVSALRLGDDAFFQMAIDPPDSIEAPAVFVGYGLSLPESGYDDLKGLDLHGKIAVFIQGGPSSVPEPLRSHAQAIGERWKGLRDAGAIGWASIPNPKLLDIPWERITPMRLTPSIILTDKTLDERLGQHFAVAVNPAKAQQLFAGSGHELQSILALADSGSSLPTFPLTVRFRAKVAYVRSPVESQNVVGVIPGSDPALRSEYVVLSAHLDHLGVAAPVDGDSIYNGAMDNAAGVAAMIEVARGIAMSRVKPRRSILLLAVTAEEKGLQGSRYFAAHPTVRADRIVADLNLDMHLPIVPLRHLIVFGVDESDLGDLTRSVAARLGVVVQPDPEPRRNRFIRSDQYSFIRRGIPSLAFKFGYAFGSPEESLLTGWVHSRYHAPSDDLHQPVDLGGAAAFNRLLLDLVEQVANRTERPHWKAGSFFSRFRPEAVKSKAHERDQTLRLGWRNDEIANP